MGTGVDFREPRKRLITWVQRQLIGPPPPTGPDEPDLVGVSPTERFPCGALYPTSPGGEGIDPASEDLEEEDLGLEATEEESAKPIITRRYVPPSSLGFSFFVTGSTVKCQIICAGVRYLNKRDEGRFTANWERRPLSDDSTGSSFTVDCPLEDGRQQQLVLGNFARVDILWRAFGGGWIATVALCNIKKLEPAGLGEYVNDREEKTLFETSLRCVIEAGEVGVYPRVDRSLLDDEEQELELQYRERHIYAIGHGCAVDWTLRAGKVVELWSSALPVVEVPEKTADTGSGTERALSLAHLARCDAGPSEIVGELKSFVDNYEQWVSGQGASRDRLSSHDDDFPAADRIVDRMVTAVGRMRRALSMLAKNIECRTAFALANRAMLNQMRQSHQIQGKADDEEAHRWRPFQLAFLLTTLESVANEDSDFRDTVDLIWFPTGGGKTEAYLGLISFVVALRRLRHPATGGGTTVLMRYTLRLLTRDQFVRAARLICALELIRRERRDLGEGPITIGLWVGEATSPNTFLGTTELLKRARDGDERPGLVLDSCPWCGQRFGLADSYEIGPAKFHFLCRNSECAFGASRDGVLPCNVVDEALYAEPPTLLVATLDKFSRLAWEDRANSFFGHEHARPPELIVQDELHLIAGALGTIAGLYEAALDTVIQMRGLYPKIIASTATIRMAAQQVERLYGRKLAVSPPPGLSCDDSYFARTEPLEKVPGRLYVGYLAPRLNRQQCMAPLAAALLAAPSILFSEDQDKEELLDAWWTQVVYHGSLKAVGSSHAVFASAVRDFMQLLLGKQSSGQAGPEAHGDADALERLSPQIAQLTSLQTAEKNSEIFARLRRGRREDGCLDAVLATNMVSVGLDVGRLGLMVINGQPLTTAEYIQASSRVGRSTVPGLVFANYYRNEARSLSHYEGFRPYHEAFYRFVEPTSVTPYTYQARLRALHAA